MVILMERSYRRVLLYGKKQDDGKMGRSKKRLAKLERSGPCVIRSIITIAMHEMEGATDVGVCKSWTTSNELGLLDVFKVNPIKFARHFVTSELQNALQVLGYRAATMVRGI